MIELKNVSFRYKDSEQDNSLTNVNLSIHDVEDQGAEKQQSHGY